MKSMRRWMLGAAVVAGTMGLTTTAAQAAEFGIYVRGPVAYQPPCPGPGYEWVAGYSSDGYWIPGRWNYVGVVDRTYYHRDWDRDRYDHHDWDRDRYDHRDWDRDRHFDRDHDRDHEDRGWHGRR